MDFELPNVFDVIVIGTGFTESVVAAAASRIGKTVLHLDPNDYYGGVWASFNLENFLALSTSTATTLRNFQINWHERERIRNSDESTTDVVQSIKDTLLKESRKFNIDLMPKLLYARGELVELLISSNICRYAEFRAVDRVVTLMGDNIVSVPCSRSDVFNSKAVSVVEKRLLMKIMNNCMNFNRDEENEEFRDIANKTFQQFLKEKKLTDKLIHYILYAISSSDDSTPCVKGIENTKKFLSSLGRYGNTPFLFPMYGCGEIPQCFCRLCAVFGGVYCLKRPCSDLRFNELGQFESIQCGEQQIKGTHLVVENGNSLLEQQRQRNETTNRESAISRGVFIIDKPIGGDELNDGGGGVIYMRMTSSVNKSIDANVIQLSHYSGCCPKGNYLIHISTAYCAGATKDLKPFTDELFVANCDTKPNPLFSCYFEIVGTERVGDDRSANSSNIHIPAGPFNDLDYDRSIQEARAIFGGMYMNEEFLPRAPDPEEIIIGDEDGEPITNQIDESINDIQEELDETEITND